MNKSIKILLAISLILITIILEFFVINGKNMFGITPNVFIAIIVVFSMFFGNIYTSIFSFLLGIFLDIVYGTNGFGIYTFCYSIVGSISSYVAKYHIKNNMSSAIGLCIISTILFELFVFLTLVFAYSVDFKIFRLIFGIVLSVILNSAFTMILYNILPKKIDD